MLHTLLFEQNFYILIQKKKQKTKNKKNVQIIVCAILIYIRKKTMCTNYGLCNLNLQKKKEKKNMYKLLFVQSFYILVSFDKKV